MSGLTDFSTKKTRAEEFDILKQALPPEYATIDSVREYARGIFRNQAKKKIRRFRRDYQTLDEMVPELFGLRDYKELKLELDDNSRPLNHRLVSRLTLDLCPLTKHNSEAKLRKICLQLYGEEHLERLTNPPKGHPRASYGFLVEHRIKYLLCSSN